MLLRAEPFSKVAAFPFQLDILFSLKLIIVFFICLIFMYLSLGPNVVSIGENKNKLQI